MQLIFETDAIDIKDKMSDVDVIENKPVSNGLGESYKNGEFSSTNGITKAVKITEDFENISERNAGSGTKKQEDEQEKADKLQLENKEKEDVADSTERALLADCGFTGNVDETATNDEYNASQGECVVEVKDSKIKENGEENPNTEDTQEENNEIKLVPKTEADVLQAYTEPNTITINAQKHDFNSAVVEKSEEDVNIVSSSEKETHKCLILDENFTENPSFVFDKINSSEDLTGLPDNIDEISKETENTCIMRTINNQSEKSCQGIVAVKINELHDNKNEKSVFSDVDSTLPRVTTESNINDVNLSLPLVTTENDINDVDSTLPLVTTEIDINDVNLTLPLVTTESDINVEDSTLPRVTTESDINDVDSTLPLVTTESDINDVDSTLPLVTTEIDINDVNLTLPLVTTESDINDEDSTLPRVTTESDINDVDLTFPLVTTESDINDEGSTLPLVTAESDINDVDSRLPLVTTASDINDMDTTLPRVTTESNINDVDSTLPLVTTDSDINDVDSTLPLLTTESDINDVDSTLPLVTTESDNNRKIEEEFEKECMQGEEIMEVDDFEIDNNASPVEKKESKDLMDCDTELKATESLPVKDANHSEQVEKIICSVTDNEEQNDRAVTINSSDNSEDCVEVKELSGQSPKLIINSKSQSDDEMVEVEQDVATEENNVMTKETDVTKPKEKSFSVVKSEEVINEDGKELVTEKPKQVSNEDFQKLVTGESKEIINDDVKELFTEETTEAIKENVKELVTEESNKEITEEVKGIVTEELKEVITEEVKEVFIEEPKASIEIEKDGILENNISKMTSPKQKPIDNQKSVSLKRSFSGLSNTLDILSDDEDDNYEEAVMPTPSETENKCINIEDDDDVMLIDEELATKDEKTEPKKSEEETQKDPEKKQVDEVNVSKPIEENQDISNIGYNIFNNNEITQSTETSLEIEKGRINEKAEEKTYTILKVKEKKPLVPPNFLKTFKKNVAEMTRDDLEEFCLLKIVEGVVDRSNLSEIKSKLKTISQNMEEWRKKAMMLTKQNRDLQIVLKTVQEEQKKKPDVPIAPLKITRSVGMQVYMAENNERGVKRKVSNHTPPQNTRNRPAVNPSPSTPAPNVRPAKPNNNNAQIPVPRLVLASNSSPAKNTKPANSIVQNCTVSSNTEKASPVANTVKPPPPVKSAEKRSFSTVQSVTVDLTDDEPPAKQMATSRNPTQASPVRVVNQNQLMGPRAQSFNQQNNNGGPRKVYIPINQNQGIRAGQTIMLKSVQAPSPRPRAIGPMIRLPGPMRIPRPSPTLRHPAPLPTVAKQSQPPNWKALPPAPDLKISKVENGIVISWKIEGYQEDSYETIASYQLYAYQETSSPSTLLWKKIGDVKALPLPMACTLTQFVAGYKYYFAVRAVDVRSRIGPFSLPGSILLLNK